MCLKTDYVMGFGVFILSMTNVCEDKLKGLGSVTSGSFFTSKQANVFDLRVIYDGLFRSHQPKICWHPNRADGTH